MRQTAPPCPPASLRVLFKSLPAGNDESIRIDFDLDSRGSAGTIHNADGSIGGAFFFQDTTSR